ncbi:aminotransferase [Aspergillus pseudocaelatus]|uniref:Aminotransferase n=1 Tax=Aspergillus pseudocaelatus TaxID=1825620 RepID=A0ABQ6W1D5_9EURO|nr:aminotransferase [Aspergillus pseudocaelatus]
MFYIILGYMPPVDMVPGGMNLLTSPDNMVQSWTGGFGYAKVGANYGPSVLASQAASREGFHQTLWLYGEDGECTEAGGSNFFVLILDGITRRRCLELAKERFNDLLITERMFTIQEFIEAAAEGRLLESFSAATAWFITSVSHIRHGGQDIKIPMGTDGNMGEVTCKIKTWFGYIMYGRMKHPWAVVVAEDQR